MSAGTIKQILYASLLISACFIACKSSDHVKNPEAKSDVKVAEKTDSSFTYDSVKKYVYLTFDDGPQPGTMNCFHIVRDLGVKASFFMIGAQIDTKNLEKRVDSIRSSYPQILLCNHSFTHGNFNHYKSFYSNADSAVRDVDKAQSDMKLSLKIFRTPANNSWNINGRIKCPELTKQLCTLLGNAGYEVAGWDVEWNFKQKGGYTPVESADSIIKNIETAIDNNNKNFVPDHIVILTHDRMFEKPQYADSLKKVIAALQKDNRIVFETIDNYPGIKHK